MFSLSYGERELVFYRANIARFLNTQFGVRLRHSECLKSPLELLQGGKKALFNGPQLPRL